MVDVIILTFQLFAERMKFFFFVKMGLGLKRAAFLTSGAFFLLNLSHFVDPVTGFVVGNNCRISYDVAICSKEKLQDVPRDIPPTVKGFDLSSNKISRIHSSDFKTLPLLESLDLKNNKISQVDEGAFANLNLLKEMNLNNNELGKLTTGLFDGLQNLTTLRVSRNKIKMLVPSSLMPLVSLTFLDISGNVLGGNIQPIFQLPNLQHLMMGANKVKVFQWGELTNTSLQLKYLDLSLNPITTFRITADIFPNLTWLNIGSTFKKQHITWDVHRFLGQVSILDISKLGLGHRDMTSLMASVNSSLKVLRMNSMTCSLAELVNISCSIQSVSKLQLRHNKLRSLKSSFFHLCANITELDLEQNKLDSIDAGAFRSMPELKVLTLSNNNLKFVQEATRNLRALVELDLSKNQIDTLQCDDFANLTNLRKLSLSDNSISALPDCVFKDLTQLQVLKLHNNSISKLNRAFQISLPNLKYLHLGFNKLVAINHGEFKNLKSLQNLSLSFNQIKTLREGSFIGLNNLIEMLMVSNQLETKLIANNTFNDLINLRRLDLRNNRITYSDSRPLHYPPFAKLSRLETLAFLSQHHRGKSLLPCNILEGLSSLLDFSCRNSQLLSLDKDMFTYTPRLQKLDISSNDLNDLPPDLFHPIPDVRSLYISRISLRSLDFIKEAKLNKLEFLQSRKNAFSIITEDVFKSLPELQYVDFQGNSFTCDCDNAWFLQWATSNNRTQVFDAYNFECNYPAELKGEKLLDLNTQSCIIDTDFICFISTTCVILLFMAVSFTYHFLRWQLTYAYYFVLAMLVDTKHKNQQTLHQYDAFVSYNAHDELWVLRKLLPKLEEEQGWRLCLHHRDFEPGKGLTFIDIKVVHFMKMSLQRASLSVC